MRSLSFLFLIHICIAGFGQSVSLNEATAIATEFSRQYNLNCNIVSAQAYTDGDNDTLYYYLQAEPHHYFVVAADQRVQPVLAWSATSQFNSEKPFAQMLAADVKNRMEAASNFTNAQKNIIRSQWNDLSDGYTPTAKFEQWPAAGTTTTDGWVETHWTQSAPYNQFCPMDPVTSSRSYTGCPATAMAQILNYLKTTQNTRFDDADDYYHNYAGRNYNIDDDWDSLSFLSFPDLNIWLDSIDILYQSGTDASGASAAALTFACGTACVQVYTSEGSGTFSVNQAFDAYQRFGFLNSMLMTTTDSTMYYALIENMKQGFPAHLAVVDAAWSVGHNVVVDGYNTDGYFHINFGWGGSNDGWWLVPDPGFPYSMGVLEGIVLDIIPVSAAIQESDFELNVPLFPNPAHNQLFFDNPTTGMVQYEIFNSTGQQVQSGKCQNSIDIHQLKSGIYYVRLNMNEKRQVAKVVIE